MLQNLIAKGFRKIRRWILAPQGSSLPREIFTPLNLPFLFNWGMSMKSKVYPVGPGDRTGAHFAGVGPEDRTGVCLRL